MNCLFFLNGYSVTCHICHTFSLLLLCMMLIPVACSEDAPGDAEGSRTAGSGRPLPDDAAPSTYQIFRSVQAEPHTLDLSLDAYAAGDLIHIFETLVVVHPNMELRPGAADRWEPNEDGTAWTFYLREGNKWSDGRPVTAHDFEYSFKRMLDPKEAGNYAFVYYDIVGARDFNAGKSEDQESVGIRAIDDHTLVIDLLKPTPYLPNLLAFVTAIPVPRWQVEKFGQKWTQGNNSISTGPYMVGEWLPGQYITYIPNLDYSGPYKGYLDQIQWLFSGDPTALLNAYENDEIDVHALSAIELGRIEQDAKLNKELVRSHSNTTWYLFFKTATAPFNDQRVRQAIAHSVDRDILTKTVMKGAGIPAYTMMPPGMKDHLQMDFSNYQAYDPSKGQKLLADAGFPDGRGFPKMELWLRGADVLQLQVAQAIQGMLKEKLGIDVTIQNQETHVYFDNMYRYDIPFSLIAFNQDFADPVNMISQVWRSRDVGFGRHDWKNVTFDRLVDQADSEMTAENRRGLYREAQRVLAEDAGGVFLYYQVDLRLVKPWVKNYTRGETPGYPGYMRLSRVWDVYIG
ncbi:MAG: peptide ABC transporter substrate-binding protein, partial [Gemmatimonadota bacterium]|nr:peptide ABC transporter substrate-binding protein [Gemmatimonadota bacterium]